MALAMFRAFASLVRNLVLANALGACFLVIYLMLCGFILAPGETPSILLLRAAIGRDASNLRWEFWENSCCIST